MIEISKEMQDIIDNTKAKRKYTGWTPEQVKVIWLAWENSNKRTLSLSLHKDTERCKSVYNFLMDYCENEGKHTLTDEEIVNITNEINNK